MAKRRSPPPPAGSPPRRPARWRRLALLLAATLLAAGAFALLARRPGAAATAGHAAAPSGSSHQRMLSTLRALRDQAAEDNLYLGRRWVREARAKLEGLGAAAGPDERRAALMALGAAELNSGDNAGAIAHYQVAWELVQQQPRAIAEPDAIEATYRLAIAWLRHGETSNCAQRHGGASCILPIEEAGRHTDQEGSRQAMRFFRQVIERTPRDSVHHVKSLWLYNIAAMTVGDYPDRLPAELRIPESVWGSTTGSIPRFRNIAPELGLASFNLFGSMVIDDLTGDGWLDMFTTTFDPAESAKLLVNQRDGTFADRSAAASLDGLFGGLNAVQGDYDNDGDPDVLVLRGAWLGKDGRHPNSLLRTDRQPDGTVRFTDVTFDAGLGEVHYPTQTAGWADYDLDGDLDLYIGNEHRPGEIEAPSQLFRNNGNGTFTDVAAAAAVQSFTFVKGVAWGDYDNDRFPDLYVSSNGGPNRLYHNQGDGTFEDRALPAGVVLPMDSFPVWFFDWDNDGNLDLFVPTYRGVTDAVAHVAMSYFGARVVYELPRLYRGDGRGSFRDVAGEAGVDRLAMAMGANYGDLDHDGWLDMYLGTGYPDYEGLMPNVMYRNREGRSFEDVTMAGGFGHLQKGHAVAFADWDHDGDQDVFEQIGGTYAGDRFYDALFQNPGNGNHWLALDLAGTRSNRSAIGARIVVEISDGAQRRTVHRHVSSGGSFGANPLRQTIGLGRATRVESLDVYWPASDQTQVFRGLPVDRFLRVVEGEREWHELPLQPPRHSS